MDEISKEEFLEVKHMVKEHDKRLNDNDITLKVMDTIVLKFIESTDKLEGAITEQSKTLISIQMTMKDMSYSIASQGDKITSLENSIDSIEDKNNLNIPEWIKKNIIWLGLMALYASLFVKELFMNK